MSTSAVLFVHNAASLGEIVAHLERAFRTPTAESLAIARGERFEMSDEGLTFDLEDYNVVIMRNESARYRLR